MFTKLGGFAAGLLILLATSGVHAAEKYIVQNGAPSPGSSYLDVYVADHLGFFEDEGLDVEFRYSANASQALQLAASGAVDAARVAFEPYLAGYAAGLRGKFYMRSYNHNIFFVAVPEASDIVDVDDLDGKTIGVLNMGGSALVVTRSLLKHAGLPHDNKVFLPVGSGPAALQALESGQVSALSLWDSGYSALERLGAKFRYFHHPEIGLVGNAGIFISDEMSKEKSEQHINFLRALVKARLWIAENPEEAVQVYWDSVPNSKIGDTPEQQLANGLKEISFMEPFPKGLSAKEQGRFDFKDLEKYLNVMKEEGIANANLAEEGIFSNELLDQIGEIDVNSATSRSYTQGK